MWQARVRKALEGHLNQAELQEAARLTEEWKAQYIDSDRRLLAIEVCQLVGNVGKVKIHLPNGSLSRGMLEQARRAMESAAKGLVVEQKFLVNPKDLPGSLTSAYFTARRREEELEVTMHYAAKRPTEFIKLEVNLASPDPVEGVVSDEPAPATAGEGSNDGAPEPRHAGVV